MEVKSLKSTKIYLPYFEMQLLKAIKYGKDRLSPYKSRTHPARWKTKTMPSEIGLSALTSDAFLNQKPNKQTSHE